MQILIPQEGEQRHYRIFPAVREESESSIDDAIRQKERTLRAKLEVLAGHVLERLSLRENALGKLESEQTRVDEAIQQIGRAARYHWREHKELSPFYEAIFRLEKERREQDVECWRDVVMVMRDFLTSWEAHQEEKMRRALLDD